MSELPPHDPETMLRIQQFAESALEELARRGEADGIDPVQFHLAVCIATMGYLANKFGPERAANLIDQLNEMIRARTPQ
jgi:hypothetical protein